MNRSRWIQLGLGALVIAALGFVVYSNRADIPAARGALDEASHRWLLVGTGLFVAWCVVWVLLHISSRRAVGVGHYREFLRLLPVTMAAVATNTVVKSGGIAGLAFFRGDARANGQSTNRASAGYLIVAAFVDVGFIFPLLLGVAIATHDRKVHVAEAVAIAIFLLLFAVRVVSIVAAVRSKDTVVRLYRLPFALWDRIRRRPVRQDIDVTPAEELYDAVQLVREKPVAAIPPMVFAVLIDLIGVAMLWAALAAVGGGHHLLIALVAYVISIVFASVGPMPGGIGFAELGAAGVMVSFGIPLGVAGAAALIFRLWEFWLPLAIGSACAWVLRRHLGLSRAEAAA
jgi:uncharacterized protein (TIRG00374 family)